MSRSGRSADNVSQSRPKRAIVPGVKLWTTTSAQSTRRRAARWPPSVARLSAMPSLDVLKFAMNWALLMPGLPSRNGGSTRVTSSFASDSTRTTVAP